MWLDIVVVEIKIFYITLLFWGLELIFIITNTFSAVLYTPDMCRDDTKKIKKILRANFGKIHFFGGLKLVGVCET